METVDGLSVTVPLLSPRGTISHTPERSISSAWPPAFLPAGLVFSHFCLSNHVPDSFLLHFSYSNAERQMIDFLKPPPFSQKSTSIWISTGPGSGSNEVTCDGEDEEEKGETSSELST